MDVYTHARLSVISIKLIIHYYRDDYSQIVQKLSKVIKRNKSRSIDTKQAWTKYLSNNNNLTSKLQIFYILHYLSMIIIIPLFQFVVFQQKFHP